MNSIRPLPRSLAPHPDESLVGYLLNLSARLRVSPLLLGQRVGLIPEGGYTARRIAATHAVVLPEKATTVLVDACRLTVEEAARLTLDRWADLMLVPIDVYGAPRSGAGRAWVSPPTTRACPECLLRPEAGSEPSRYATWQVRWTTPWSFVCTVHGRLLLDRCPSCTTRLGLEHARDEYGARNTFGLIPSMATAGLHPASCRARVTGADGHTVACGYRLDQAEQTTAASPELLVAQRRLDSLLDGQRHDLKSLGAAVGAAQYLRDLRLTAFALQIIAADAWPLPAPTGTALAVAAAAQDLAEEPVGGARRGGQRWRLWTEPPADVHVTAAVIVTAMQILDADSTAEARPALVPLIAAAAEAEPRLWSRSRSIGGPSSRLSRFTSPGNGGLISVHVLKRSVPTTPDTLEGRHVPQMAGDELDALVAPLAPGSSARERQRATSLALYRLITSCEMETAVAALDIPLERARSSVGRFGKALRANGKDDAFWQLLPALVDRLAAAPVDWAARRAAMVNWRLTDTAWSEVDQLLQNAGARDTNAPELRTAAEILIWEAVTSGDRFLSPSASGLADAVRKDTWNRMRSLERRPEQAAALDQYAAALAATLPAPGSAQIA